MHPVHNQHFDADEAQDEGEAVFEEDETVGDIGKQEIHGTQPEYGEDVGGEDDEGVGGYGEDGGNAVHGEDDIAQLYHDEDEQKRGGDALAVFDGKEFFAFKLMADGDDFFKPAQNLVLREVLFFGFRFHHMDAGIDEECAENVENPFEPLHQCRADKNHEGAQDDGAEHAVKEDAVLVFRGNFEVTENHQENKDVVNGKGFFEDVAGEKFESLFFGNDGAVKGVACQLEIEPACEGTGYGDPDATPGDGFFDTDFMRAAFFKREHVDDDHDENSGEEHAVEKGGADGRVFGHVFGFLVMRWLDGGFSDDPSGKGRLKTAYQDK